MQPVVCLSRGAETKLQRFDVIIVQAQKCGKQIAEILVGLPAKYGDRLLTLSVA